MGLLGWKTVSVALLSILLAVYVNYPAPTQISSHLASWQKHEAHTTIFRGHRIFYKDAIGKKPEGPVLVCLHGFPTSSYDWLKVWPALVEKFGRVIAPDFIGYGFSDKPLPHSYSIMEQADLVEHLLSSLGLPRVHLLTHDYGDTVGQEILARFEDRKSAKKDGLAITSLCLLNGGMFPETNFPRPLQKALLIPYVGAVLGHLTNIHVFSRGFGEVFGPETQPTLEEFRDFWALIRRDDGNLVMGPLLQYIPERSANKARWTGALQKTNVPVQTIYGPADPVNPPGFVDFYKKTVPNPYVSVLKGHIGHYPQWEDPAGVMKEYFKFVKTLPYTQETPRKSPKDAKSADKKVDEKKQSGETTAQKSKSPEKKVEKKQPPKPVKHSEKKQTGKPSTDPSKTEQSRKQTPPESNTSDKKISKQKDKITRESSEGKKKPTKAPPECKKDFTVDKDKSKKRTRRNNDIMPGDADFIDIELKRRDKD